ncbi:MAG: hypothetical protein ACKOAH_09560 [Pirellula sp.]
MEWTLSPVFGSYGLVSLIAIGLLFVWFFVMDLQGLTRFQKWILRLIRLMLIALLMLIMVTLYDDAHDIDDNGDGSRI